MKRTLLSLLAVSFLLIPFCAKAQTWSSFTPQPTTQLLYNVFALDANNAWAVGNSGTILTWNGTSWSTATASSSSRYSVWASSPSNVYVVGINTGNQLFRYNGTTWENLLTANNFWGTGGIRAVWGSGANNVWISGGNGRAFNFNGTTWTALNSGLPSTFTGYDFWGTDANNIWLAGTNVSIGEVYKWNSSNSTWENQLTGIAALRGIWGIDGNNIWVAGGVGNANPGIIYRFNGTSWTDVSPSGAASFMNIGGADASNIWAVGHQGTMFKFDGTSWSSQTSNTSGTLYAVAAGITGTNARLWAVGEGHSGLNPVNTASVTVSALPLTWGSFTYRINGGNTELSWSTLTEQNTRSFEIEHQFENGTWQVLGTVTAAGNSDTKIDYSYLHTAPQKGTNNYRIKQIDLDGRSSYSATISTIVKTASAGLTMRTNIVYSGTLELQNSTPQSIAVYDMNGRELIRKNIGQGSSQINVSALPTGTYVLKHQNGAERFIIK